MKMDVEGLYSMDLQEVASGIAQRIHLPHVLDAFCGVGGAAIAFARAGKRVTAIEIDSERLAMSKHNARLFSVDDRIQFVEGDCTTMLYQLKDTAVYLDPPWGGPDYGKLDQFLLGHFSPNGDTLIKQALSASPEVVCKLPKNFDFSELDRFQRPFEIVENIVGGQLEYFTAYFQKQ